MPPTENVAVRIDAHFIATTTDHMSVIDPVWEIANFYETPEAYELSLAPFSQAQRHVWAMQWYLSEVNNGGHDQFYFNSTGMVWRDALAGFVEADLMGLAGILRASTERFDTPPSLNRDERQEQLDRCAIGFDDLDTRLYASAESDGFPETMLAFIRKRPEDFFFEGTIERVTYAPLDEAHPKSLGLIERLWGRFLGNRQR